MRITESQHQAILEVIRAHFGPESRVWLFGSRADDQRRGGDVDLYVEAGQDPETGRASLKLDAVVALEHILDGQSVDLVVRFARDPERIIHRIAKIHGVLL